MTLKKKIQELTEIASLIKQNDNFIILTHLNPDGDAMGSASGMLYALEEKGKKAVALLPEPVPDNYSDLLPEALKTITREKLNSFDFCVCLDISVPDRAGLPEPLKYSDITIPVINLDHHPDNSLFGTYNFVDPEASATAEILKTLLDLSRWPVSERNATRLLTGIIMDTGCFRFDNTSPEAMRKSAELLEAGADHHAVIEKMFFSQKENYIKFNADVCLNHMKTVLEGKLALITLNEAVLRKHAVAIKNTEGLIDFARSIDTAVAAALIHPRDNGFKVSMRSKTPLLSVGGIARQLGGGGHEMAAGCFIETSNPRKAEEVITGYFKEYLKKLQ
jgi:phosphoesterase RecJ-like protein